VAATLWEWSVDPVPTAGVLVAAAAYADALRRTRGGARRFPWGRTLCFAAGLAAIVVALDGPPDALSESSFSVHMVQHMLLQMVAAPLLLLGGPITLVLRADPGWLRRRLLVRLLRSGPARVLTHPVTTLSSFVVVLVATHLTGFYELSLQHPGVHASEHAAYLVTALIMWWPAIGVDPAPHRMSHPARLLYLFVMMPVPALLGVAIAESGRTLYPWYLTHPTPWGASALADQRAAGTILWISGMFTVAPAMGVVLWRWLDQDEQSQVRREALASRRSTQATPG